MSRDAFVLRTAVFGGDPLAALIGNLQGGSTICDFGRRDKAAARSAELQIYMHWRLGTAEGEVLGGERAASYQGHVGHALPADGVVAVHCSDATRELVHSTRLTLTGTYTGSDGEGCRNAHSWLLKEGPLPKGGVLWHRAVAFASIHDQMLPHIMPSLSVLSVLRLLKSSA